MVSKASPLMIAPLGIWAISLPIPFFSISYFYMSLWIIIPYLLFIVFIDITGKNKSGKMMSYAGYISLLLMCIFFGAPAFKLSSGSLFFQILIVLIALIIIFIVQKNNTFIAESLTGDNRNPTFVLAYFGLIVLIIFAGGGGYYLAAEHFAKRFGQVAMENYFSILLLLGGYWLLVFTQSTTSRFKNFTN
jgi:hypothetical protein